MDLIESLKWRYAVKKFDSSKKVSDADLAELLEAVRLSPSSHGLQPWKFLIVKDAAVREKLKAAAWGQPQITDASCLIVLSSLDKMDHNHVDKYVESIAKNRNVSVESLAGYRNTLSEFVSESTPEHLDGWMNQQVHIALGILLAASALKNIDACPMGGFENDKFDEILGLQKLGLKSRVLCALGYRSPDDGAAKKAKARFDKKDIFIEI